MITKRGLSKEERLCSQKSLDELFREGNSFVRFPFRVVWIKREKTDVPVRILVSVSKSKFKRAVRRNRIKRVLRESYRLNKESLLLKMDESSFGIDIAFLWLPKEEPPFSKVFFKMKDALSIIEKEICEG